MQYVLTQEELDGLTSKAELSKAGAAIAALRELVVPKGKCVHHAGGPRYCDECPLSSIGPVDSPQRPSRELSKIMCPLARAYSK